MSFSDDTVRNAFIRAGGHCEKCGKQLSWTNRGRSGRGCWEAHHGNPVSSGGTDLPRNCRIICWDCHSKTF